MVNLLNRRLNWGDKIFHPQFGEGLVLRDNNIALVKVVFKNNDEIMVFKENDDNLKLYGGEF